MTRFDLPPAPESQPDAVKAWSEPVTIPTYLPMAPDKNPMFLEKRVYQGSSGAAAEGNRSSRSSTTWDK